MQFHDCIKQQIFERNVHQRTAVALLDPSLQICIMDNKNNCTPPRAVAIIFYNFRTEDSDCVFEEKKKTKLTLRQFSIFMLKTSTLDSRVLIDYFFKYRPRYFDFGNLVNGNRIFPRVMFCSRPVLGNRVLVLLAIYTDSSSVLSANTLTNLRTHFPEQTNHVLFIQRKKGKICILFKVNYWIPRQF